MSEISIEQQIALFAKKTRLMRLQIYPALNIIGGRRYMKKRSSLKTKRCELFPPLNSKITTPVHTPCNQPTQNKWRLATFTLTNQDNYLFWWLNVHKNSNNGYEWNSQLKGQWSTRSPIGSPQEDGRSQYKHKGGPQIGSWKPRRHDQKWIAFATLTRKNSIR